MADKLRINGLKSLSVPVYILVVFLLLLGFVTGASCDREITATNPEIAKNEVKTQSRITDINNSVAEIRPSASQGTDSQKKDLPAPKNSQANLLLSRKNNLESNDSKVDQGDAAEALHTEDESLFLEKERLADPEGSIYTKAQLDELDPETIRLIEEETRQAVENQPVIEQESYQEEKAMSLPEGADVLEEERLADPEGSIYTKAQLDELDPETIRLIEEENRHASE